MAFTSKSSSARNTHQRSWKNLDLRSQRTVSGGDLRGSTERGPRREGGWLGVPGDACALASAGGASCSEGGVRGVVPPNLQITVVDSFILVTYKKPFSKWRRDIVFVCFLEESVKREKYKTSRGYNGLFGHQEQTVQCLGYPVTADSFVFVLRFFFFKIQMRLFWVHNLLV